MKGAHVKASGRLYVQMGNDICMRASTTFFYFSSVAAGSSPLSLLTFFSGLDARRTRFFRPSKVYSCSLAGSVSMLRPSPLVPKIILAFPKVIPGISKVVLVIPKVVLGIPKVVLGVPKVVLGIPKVVLGIPKVILGIPKVVLAVPKVVLGIPLENWAENERIK